MSSDSHDRPRVRPGTPPIIAHPAAPDWRMYPPPGQHRHVAPAQPPSRPPVDYYGRARLTMSAAASFWYILGCVYFGAMYMLKVPAKKALQDAGVAQMTSAEQFWYVLGCIPLGFMYFAKLPIKKALTESFLP